MTDDQCGPAAYFRRELVRDPEGRLYRREIIDRAAGLGPKSRREPYYRDANDTLRCVAFGVTVASVMSAFRRATGGARFVNGCYEGWSWK